MIRSFKYCLYPTRTQERTLRDWLRLTRELYNAALDERRQAYAKQRVSISCFDQTRQLPEVRGVRPEFDEIPISIQRGALRRLDKSFKAFFKRCKSGNEKPGFPRFKSAPRWRSLLNDDLGKKSPVVAGGRRIQVPLLGKVRFKQHRPVEGKPKAMRITLDGGGRWYVTLACADVPEKPLAPSGEEVGVDLGLIHFAATSDGELHENPRPLRAAQQGLARAQRRVSRRKRGSQRRREAVRLLAREHTRVANVRRESHIKIAKDLVSKYGVIYVEDLNIKGLARSKLVKSVNDAAWGGFLHWLRVKAESAGREVVEVAPRGTSQTCPDCGKIEKKALSQRVHRCVCGLVCDRDVAAARVVLGLGRSLRGVASPVGERRRSAKPEFAQGLCAGDFLGQKILLEE